MQTLLSPAATALERAIVQVDTERLDAIRIAIASLWTPADCPADLLPWLAWAFSVDVWDADWSEAKKRAVIAAAFGVHRAKGTRKAIVGALKAMNFAVDIEEWWQMTPTGDPYTFAVEVTTPEGMTAARQNEALAAVAAAKNVRSHLTAMRMFVEVKSPAPHIAAALYSAETATVYPEACA